MPLSSLPMKRYWNRENMGKCLSPQDHLGFSHGDEHLSSKNLHTPPTPNPQPLTWPSAYHRPCYGSSKKKTVGEEHHVPMDSFKRKGLLREKAISSPFSSSKKFHSVVYNVKIFQIWELPLLEKLSYLLPLAPYHPFAPYSALYSYSIVYPLMY